MGGGAALPFGSGAPGLPSPGTKRAAELARQWRDDARGRFTERLFVFPDSGLVAPNTQTENSQGVPIVSNRTSFVRLVAIKGSILSSISEGANVYEAGVDEANMRLRLQINGEEDLVTTGQGSGFAPYSDLFQPTAPWLWFAAPPRLRVNDVLLANWENTYGTADSPITKNLCATLTARICDDRWWQALYGT